MRCSIRAPEVDHWGRFADFLGTPVIVAVVLVSLVFGLSGGCCPRVVAGAAFATIALEVNEHVVKPLVQERFRGALGFPSGHVTAGLRHGAWPCGSRCTPSSGDSGRAITFALGAAWTLLMSVAVVGAFWHTPLDDVGSLLLSVGFVTAGAAILGPKKRAPAPPVETEPEPVTAGV